MTEQIENIKTLLNGKIEDKLPIIVSMTKKRLGVLLKIGDNEIPEQFDYIITDVSLKRFNRLGNEGMQSYSQEGLSMAFPDSDFDEYAGEIEDYIKENDPVYQKRKSAARFY